jgi:hypothetical protein
VTFSLRSSSHIVHFFLFLGFSSIFLVCLSSFIAFGAAHVAKHHQKLSSIGECGYDNCIFPVTINAAVIVFMEVLWRFLSRFIFPFLVMSFSRCCHPQRSSHHSSLEKEAVSRHNQPVVKKVSLKEHNPHDDDDFDQEMKEKEKLEETREVDDQSHAFSIDSQYVKRNASQFQQANPMKGKESPSEGGSPSPSSFAKKFSFLSSHPFNMKKKKTPVVVTLGGGDYDEEEGNVSSERKLERTASNLYKNKYSMMDIDINEEMTTTPAKKKNQTTSNRREQATNYFADDEEGEEVGNSGAKGQEDDEEEASVRNGGFSSAGELTPQNRSFRSKTDFNDDGEEEGTEADKTERRSEVSNHRGRKSNLDEFYNEFPLDDNDTRDNKDKRRSSVKKKKSQLSTFSLKGEEDEDDDDREGTFIEDDDEDEDEGSIGDSYYRKKAPFERYSLVATSYDVEDHHLSNHSFIFRLFCIALLFGVTAPVIFFALMIVLFFMIRMELWLLMSYFPRCLPLISEEIDVIWKFSYDLLLILSIGTNASLIIFDLYQSHYSHWSLDYLLCLWIGIVGVLLFFFLLCYLFYSRVPKEVRIQRQRRDLIVSKLIDRIPDRNDSLPIEIL